MLPAAAIPPPAAGTPTIRAVPPPSLSTATAMTMAPVPSLLPAIPNLPSPAVEFRAASSSSYASVLSSPATGPATPAQIVPASILGSHAALTCASSLEFPAERMEPAALAARTGSLSRWLRVHLFEYTQHQVSLLEEPGIAQDIFSDKIQSRGLGFFFNLSNHSSRIAGRKKQYVPSNAESSLRRIRD